MDTCMHAWMDEGDDSFEASLPHAYHQSFKEPIAVFCFCRRGKWQVVPDEGDGFFEVVTRSDWAALQGFHSGGGDLRCEDGPQSHAVRSSRIVFTSSDDKHADINGLQGLRSDGGAQVK